MSTTRLSAYMQRRGISINDSALAYSDLYRFGCSYGWVRADEASTFGSVWKWRPKEAENFGRIAVSFAFSVKCRLSAALAAFLMLLI